MKGIQRYSGFLDVFNRPLPQYFRKEEIRKIIENAPGRNPKEIFRNKLILEMLWQTGARVSELLKIRPCDIDYYAKTIKIITLKRKKFTVRVVPVKSELLGMIAQYIINFKINNEEPLFKITKREVERIVKKACKNAGIDDKRAHPHTFRHSFAVFHTLNRVPPAVLKEWLGHAKIENTLIYLKILSIDTRNYVENCEY